MTFGFAAPRKRGLSTPCAGSPQACLARERWVGRDGRREPQHTPGPGLLHCAWDLYPGEAAAPRRAASWGRAGHGPRGGLGDEWAPCGPGTDQLPPSCIANGSEQGLGAALTGSSAVSRLQPHPQLREPPKCSLRAARPARGQGKSRAHVIVYRRGCRQSDSGNGFAHTPLHLCCYKKQAGLWPRRPGTTPNSCLGRAPGRGVGGRKGWGRKQSLFSGCCVRLGHGPRQRSRGTPQKFHQA